MPKKIITPFSELDKKGQLAIRKKAYTRWSNNSEKNRTNVQRVMDIGRELGMTKKEVLYYKEKDRWQDKYEKHLVKQEANKHSEIENVVKKTSIKEIEKIKEKQKQIDDVLNESGLNEKYQLFILHYLQSYNVKAAQVKAGYSPKAKAAGFNILNDGRVQRVMKQVKELMREEIYLTAHDILTEYVRIASADMTDFVEFDGRRVKLKDSSQVDGKLIQEVKQGKDGVTIKLIDKKFAIEKLEKLFDVIEDKRLELDKMKYELQKKVIEKQLGENNSGNKIVIVNDL
jgi:phage terminase small subunit